MQRRLTWVWALIAVLLLGSTYALWPTVKLRMMDKAEKEAAKERDPAAWIKLKKQAIKLGLDLQGGMRVVMQVDKSKLSPREAEDAVDRAKEIIRNRVDQLGVEEPLIQTQGEDRIIVELAGISDPDRAQELIGKTALLEFKLLESPENTRSIIDAIDLVLEARDTTSRKPVPQQEDIFDIFSDSATQADTTELASAEGDTSMPDSAAEIEPPVTGERPFSILLEPAGNRFAVAVEDAAWIHRWLNDPDIQGEIPPDVHVTWGSRTEFWSNMEVQYLYFLKSNVEFSGKYLTDARPSFDQFRKPIVNFNLTRKGGRIFARLTGANIGKPLAIVLDDRVVSAPEIQGRIPDNGQITMGGNAKYEDAVDLAIILKAGALPTPVNIIGQSIIGPSLGADSINKGLTSILIGLSLVVFFMLIYYRLSGLIADLALFLNMVFLMAVMATLDATLTMPGIAGIILTVGISVDSNVLIFERIREELRTGKTVRASIDAGYKRALVAIVDSHITTLITALALFFFGTGPIKGFAVTLAWGVGISLFTAFVITKAVFDLRKGYKTLSI